MSEIIRKFTCGQPKQMIKPVVWMTLENLFMVFPSIATIFAINYIVDGFNNTIAFDEIWSICAVLFVLFLLQAFVSVCTHLNTFLPATIHVAENKTSFINKLRTLPLGYFQEERSGKLINAFTGDFLAVQQSMVALFTGIFSVILSCVTTGVFFFVYNPIMAISFYVSVVVAVFMVVFSNKTLGKMTKQTMESKDNAATYLNEYLHGMKVLKSYNQTGKGFEKLKIAYDDVVKANLKGEVFGGTLINLAASIANLALPIMCFVGAYLILGGTLGIAEYLSIIIIGTKILMPIITWIRYMMIIRIHYVSATRIDEVFLEKPLTGHKSVDINNDIKFNDVCFAYNDKEKTNVLNKVDFTIKKGEFTAIVGPSGSGKSTILRLIARFWDVTSGSITCGKTALSDTNAEDWQKNISMVLQDVYLFHETVRENILFGNVNVTEEQMISAAKRAQCHDFIMQLPQGYDTVIGEGGCTLSGGEKQRISIARGIIKNAPVLLLDEPTSSLDAKNEVLVQRALVELVKSKTVVMVAHRLKTIQNADKILVIDKGQIAQSGTHAELLAKNGVYAKLWNMQSGAFNFKF